MTVTVEEIRAKYPNPVKAIAGNLRDGYYCVGGALCKFLYGDSGEAFPISQLNRALVAANPALARNIHCVYTKAEDFGASIIGQNDSENFEAAWKFLDEALNWKPA